jgi:DNA invertase Pin-like site-specific DNA recombinase
MDTLVEKIDILTQVTAINVQKEKFLEGKKQKDQIKMLDKLGFSPSLIALVLGTTANTVSVTLARLRKKKKKGKQPKQGEVEQNGD